MDLRANAPRIFPVFFPCRATWAALRFFFMVLRRFLPRVS